MNLSLEDMRSLVYPILLAPHNHVWTLQGFGLLRLHLHENLRLHIWVPDLQAPGVSLIHDHKQWGLESTVLSGRLQNQRYSQSKSVFGATHRWTTLIGGTDALLHRPRSTRLLRKDPEVYRPRDTYSQTPSEIHMTEARPGTVTLMRKSPSKDGKTARVCWPIGEQWVSAAPRTATVVEVNRGATLARELWDVKVSR